MSLTERLNSNAKTVREWLEIPGKAEIVRAAYYADARRIGLGKADADDGAQMAVVMLLKWGQEEREEYTPVRYFYAVRRYMRRSLYRGMTGYRRAKNRQLPEPMSSTRERLRGSMTDNPAILAMAMERAETLLMTACGRNARAIRAMSRDDIRHLACPAIQEPRTFRPAPAPTAGCPAMAGDGTEWRAADATWTEVQPVNPSRAREWLRLNG